MAGSARAAQIGLHSDRMLRLPDTPAFRQWLTRAGWLGMFSAVKPTELWQEFEQAILRVAIPFFVLILFSAKWLGGALGVWSGELSKSQEHGLEFAISFSLFAVGLALWILAHPKVSEKRRYTGILADNAANTYFMLATGEIGAAVFAIYLFVTFGNGFRYGRRHLFVSQDPISTRFRDRLVLLRVLVGTFLGCFGHRHFDVFLPFYIVHLKGKVDRAKRQAEEANKAKGRFLANVSHEMRTPLNGVIAMADILRETSLNESQREITETLSNSAQLLLAQIEDVLDMAKIEAGRVQLESAAFDLGRMLTSTIKVMLPQARYKGLAVVTDIAQDASRWFVGDQHHLRQVVLNLLSNAIKFTDRGEISLRARVVDAAHEVARVRIEIQDTGIRHSARQASQDLRAVHAS